MSQTEKAKQAGQQESQEQNQPVSIDALKELLAPLAETVAALKADKEAVSAKASAAQEAARQAQLNKDADLSTMLGEADVSDSGDDKYENMSKRQMMDVLASAVETAMEANATQIKGDIAKSLSPDLSKIGNIEKVLMGIVGNMGVQEARNKHSDFDNYREPISKIMGEVPGISFDRAYLLAKSEAAGKVPPKGQTDTEKPNESTWSPSGNQGGTIPNQGALQQIADRGKEARDNVEMTKSGTRGFRNILSAHLDNATVGEVRQD